MRALVIDLNNFSRYPTLSVGYLTSVLRKNDIKVDILSPFAKGITGYPRLTQARRHELYLNFLKHWTAVTPNKLVKQVRKTIQRIVHPGGIDDKKVILDYLHDLLANKPDVVLISAYTMYYEISCDISKACQQQNIPVIIGGSAFVHKEIAAIWYDIPGVAAVYAGEPEQHLVSLITAVLTRGDLSSYRGLYKPAERTITIAPPLTELDKLPFPDFLDFPWHAYPNKVIPLMTGRGCEWDICTFCSDVTSAAGRTFRSRSIESVIEEMRFQSQRFGTKLFVFLDLKLNSDLQVNRPEFFGGIFI